MCLQQRSFIACPHNNYMDIVWHCGLIFIDIEQLIMKLSRSQTHTENLHLALHTVMKLTSDWPKEEGNLSRFIGPTRSSFPSMAVLLIRPDQTCFQHSSNPLKWATEQTHIALHFLQGWLATCIMGPTTQTHTQVSPHTHTHSYSHTHTLTFTLTWLSREGSAFHLSKVLATFAWPFWLAKWSGVNPE